MGVLYKYGFKTSTFVLRIDLIKNVIRKIIFNSRNCIWNQGITTLAIHTNPQSTPVSCHLLTSKFVEMSDIKINAKAYCKLILHAAKYPHCAVNGVLLAKCSPKNKEIEFVDAVPLFHLALNLTPMAEVALTQIDYVAAQAGLVIAGYYTAHENIRENSLEKVYHRILDKIAENFNAACLVVINNEKLSLTLDNMALNVAQFSDGKFRPVDLQKVYLSPDHTLDVCSALLEKETYKALVDFDNHLDNISLDWMNHEVNREIEELI